MGESDVIRPVALESGDLAQATKQVAGGELAALVEIPEGYSDRLLSGQEVSLNVVADQATQVGQTAGTGLDTVVNRLLGAVETAQLSAATYDQEVGLKPKPREPPTWSRGWHRPCLPGMTHPHGSDGTGDRGSHGG